MVICKVKVRSYSLTEDSSILEMIRNAAPHARFDWAVILPDHCLIEISEITPEEESVILLKLADKVISIEASSEHI